MASIGIDFGNSFCCVATCKDGKVEVISNEHDKRLTPSCVAFTEDERLFGEAAQHQAPLNLENTIYQIKRLVGRTSDDQALRHYQRNWGFHVDQNNQLEIPITFREKEYTLRPEQISAMLLEKMKQIAEEYLRNEVENVVISVPTCFDKSQRNAIRVAGIIAGFQNIKLLKEPKAAAITFAMNRNQSSQHRILIFDIGGGKFDAAIYNIENGNATERLAEYGDPNFGGDDFDHNMMNYILDQERNISLDNKKGMFRLKAACEKAKKTLSQTTRARLQADCLNGNEPYTTTLMRTQFEEMNVNEFNSIEPILHGLLQEANLEPSQIDDIVLVGGSSRIPKIREILQKVFQGKLLNKTINPDEAVACGCAFWAEQVFASVENKPKNWPEEIQEMIEQNAIFNRGDEELREQSEARNALENTVYDMKNKIKNNQEGFDENQLQTLQQECDEVMNWLRGDGQNASVKKIKRKKSSLKKAFKRGREGQKPSDDHKDDSRDPRPKKPKPNDDQQNPSMVSNKGGGFYQPVGNIPTQHGQQQSNYRGASEASTETQKSIRDNPFLQKDDKRRLLPGSDDGNTPVAKYDSPSYSVHNEVGDSAKRSNKRSRSNRKSEQDDRQGLLQQDRDTPIENEILPGPYNSTYMQDMNQSTKPQKITRNSWIRQDKQGLLTPEDDMNPSVKVKNNRDDEASSSGKRHDNAYIREDTSHEIDEKEGLLKSKPITKSQKKHLHKENYDDSTKTHMPKSNSGQSKAGTWNHIYHQKHQDQRPVKTTQPSRGFPQDYPGDDEAAAVERSRTSRRSPQLETQQSEDDDSCMPTFITNWFRKHLCSRPRCIEQCGGSIV